MKKKNGKVGWRKHEKLAISLEIIDILIEINFKRLSNR